MSTQTTNETQSKSHQPMSHIDAWIKTVRKRARPTSFETAPEGHGLGKFQLNKGQITAVAAQTGLGKSALVNQIVFEAMRHPDQRHLRTMIANVEMSPHVMLDRELARLAQIDHERITERSYSAEEEPYVEHVIKYIETLRPRLKFMEGPFTVQKLLQEAKQWEPHVLVLDYVQHFDLGKHAHERAQAAAVINACRQIASQFCAVIIVSAINRESYYGPPSLAALRDSSELEYGCDVVYQLWQPKKKEPSRMVLAALKNRHGKLQDIPLVFRGEYLEFASAEQEEGGRDAQ